MPETRTPPRSLAVVAGVLRDAAGRVLLAQRPAAGSEAGKWEFAGGKIRVGERAEAALARELREELGIAIDTPEPLTVVRWRGAPRPLNLHSYTIDRWQGEPIAHEHQALRWALPGELKHFAMPAPDGPIRARLALPRQYLITPEPVVPGDDFVERFARAIDHPAIGIVSVRAKSLVGDSLADLAERCLTRARAQRPELIVLIHAEIGLATTLGFDGVHLSSRQLLGLRERPLPESAWVFASCHSAPELVQAEGLGADAATLSPIRATPSHPLSPALGWRRLRALAARTWLPTYALGGVGADDLAASCDAGAHGIAAIRSLWGADP